MAVSRPTSFEYGGDSVIDFVRQKLENEAETLKVARAVLPSWFSEGFDDYSCLIHSLGCTYFTSLGRDLGFQAVAEYPSPTIGPMAFVGKDVRCDSAWFVADKFQLAVIVEFERYEGVTDSWDLQWKIQSLSLAYHRSETKPFIAVLAYWTKKSAILPDHSELSHIFRHGFETIEKQRVPGITDCRLLIYQLVHEFDPRSGKWKLWRMLERGTI